MKRSTIDRLVEYARLRHIIETARQHQVINSIEELDKRLHTFLIEHGAELPTSAIAVLSYIMTNARKVIGVCWSRVDSIAHATGYSSRTVSRALSILEEYKIIRRVPYRNPRRKPRNSFRG